MIFVLLLIEPRPISNNLPDFRQIISYRYSLFYTNQPTKFYNM